MFRPIYGSTEPARLFNRQGDHAYPVVFLVQLLTFFSFHHILYNLYKNVIL